MANNENEGEVKTTKEEELVVSKKKGDKGYNVYNEGDLEKIAKDTKIPLEKLKNLKYR